MSYKPYSSDLDDESDLCAAVMLQRFLGLTFPMIFHLVKCEKAGRDAVPSVAIIDSRTLQSTHESGHRAGFDGAKKRKGSKVHAAVDTLGHVITLLVTPADEQDRDQVYDLCHQIQEVTGDQVDVVLADGGYIGEQAETDAALLDVELVA